MNAGAGRQKLELGNIAGNLHFLRSSANVVVAGVWALRCAGATAFPVKHVVSANRLNIPFHTHNAAASTACSIVMHFFEVYTVKYVCFACKDIGTVIFIGEVYVNFLNHLKIAV